MVADYEKASGNKIDYSIIPYAPQRQKIVSAITSGDVPDLIHSQPCRDRGAVCLAGQAGRCHATSSKPRSRNTATRRCCQAQCYNSVTKRRSFYGVPFTGAVLPIHIWKSLVEKAGYKIEDIPKTWDAY